MAFYCNGKQGICDCDFLCADCKFYDDKGGKDVQTNADRIRAMSDEELADFITSKEGWLSDIVRQTYYEKNVEWLKQPAEGELL